MFDSTVYNDQDLPIDRVADPRNTRARTMFTIYEITPTEWGK
jgi:hypothetical protein